MDNSVTKDNNRQGRFVELLKQIFEMDKSDLDFGIYRILNIRKNEIEKYFSDDLPKRIAEILKPFAEQGVEGIRQEMADIEKSAKSMMGVDISEIPQDSPMAIKYRELKLKLASGTDLSALESDVYSALYSFFSRYYDDGDFVSKRRYKEGVYAIPYEGEDVKLYWANQDQYYIKTSENFKDYAFNASDEISVHFRIVDATTERDNNKESDKDKRVFMLYTENEDNPDIKTFEFDEERKELIIRFVYDIPEDKKRKYDVENYEAIGNWLLRNQPKLVPLLLSEIPSEGKTTMTLLQKHLKGYIAKNEFDYFIHKDLEGFLKRELDFYIKNEIMHLEDLDTDKEALVETYIAKVRAIKRVALDIISFLAQLENFQKKLWLKKKFVVETNWCITIDHIDENFWPEIVANTAQVDEWKEMYAIGDLKDFTEPLTIEFLHKNKNLIIDTCHFTEDFKSRLLSSIDNLDEKTNGLLINGDNFQALSLLLNKYRKQVSTIYIDPPYNTDASEILYKNNYKHSSFLSLMHNRIELAKELMADNSMMAVAIDDAEVAVLMKMLDTMFAKNAGTAVVRSNPQSRKAKGKFSPQHEYCLFYSKREETNPHSIGYTESKLKRYPLEDEKGHYSWMNFIRAGNDDLRTDRSQMFYPIAVSFSDEIRILDMEWDDETEEYNLLESPREDEVLVYPIKEENGNLIEKRWQRGYDRVKKEIPLGEYRIRRVNNEIIIDFKTRMDEDAMPTTWWDKKEYASANYAPREQKQIFGKKVFEYAKAASLVKDAICASGADEEDAFVLDFFAGSATTAHAVIDLNRIDGNRKYCLVEMGEYFKKATLPRVKKIIYAPQWSKKKPKTRENSVSQIVKYMSLESYEDALSNITLTRIDKMVDLFGEKYLINYMLDIETRDSLLNLDAFNHPFDYQMKITRKNETLWHRVDVIETFNYLHGIKVENQSPISYFRAQPAAQPAYEGAVDIIEDAGSDYGFMSVKGKLQDGSSAIIVWRTVTDDVILSNAALDAYFTSQCKDWDLRNIDSIYVNGDCNLELLKKPGEHWKVVRTDKVFNQLMFD